MKKIAMAGLITVLITVCQVRADTVWDSGHHEIFEDDIYGEIWMYNDATADMFGGDVFKLETFNISSFDMHGGEMDILYVRDDSTISLYGGSLIDLGAIGDSSIDIYAYDVVHHPIGGGHYNGWIEGKYLANDLYFSFSLIHADSISHINVVPEPCSVLLLGVGSLILRKRIKR